jgi:late competence protein required for DNA uptake (superfamily II DNA/RNA helicase)
MYVFLDQEIKCSKCQSTDYENVTYLGSRFIRCRNCKHEGESKLLLPNLAEIKDSAIYKHDKNEVQTF